MLAGGTFPGTLITANKVGRTLLELACVACSHGDDQGDLFAVNVIDKLTDGRMNKTTSIVRSRISVT